MAITWLAVVGCGSPAQVDRPIGMQPLRNLTAASPESKQYAPEVARWEITRTPFVAGGPNRFSMVGVDVNSVPVKRLDMIESGDPALPRYEYRLSGLGDQIRDQFFLDTTTREYADPQGTEIIALLAAITRDLESARSREGSPYGACDCEDEQQDYDNKRWERGVTLVGGIVVGGIVGGGVCLIGAAFTAGGSCALGAAIFAGAAGGGGGGVVSLVATQPELNTLGQRLEECRARWISREAAAACNGAYQVLVADPQCPGLFTGCECVAGTGPRYPSGPLVCDQYCPNSPRLPDKPCPCWIAYNDVQVPYCVEPLGAATPDTSGTHPSGYNCNAYSGARTISLWAGAAYCCPAPPPGPSVNCYHSIPLQCPATGECFETLP